MSPLSAADLAADPLTVLVLAWDEAAPATRVLLTALDADSATAHALLLVPHAAAPTSAAAIVHAASEPIRVPPESATHAAITASPPALGQVVAADNAAKLPDSATAPIPENTLAASVAAAPPAAAYATVRVLRLGDFTLAELAARAGRPLPVAGGRSRATPAAPYLGSAEVVDSDELSPPLIRPASPEPAETVAPVLKLPAVLPVVPPSLLADESGAPVGPTAAAPDPAADAHPPANAPELASAAWAAALATLAAPAPEAASAAPATDPWPLALNFEVIQFARLAVPLALSEGPFSLIYAPSWPSWLAAHELSQRTSQPLVLHLSALAAGSAPADTAVGWAAELQRQVLRQADLVLVENYALARRLFRELGLATAAVRVAAAAEPAAIVLALRNLVSRRNTNPNPAATSSDEAADLTDPLTDPLANLPVGFNRPADDHPAAPTE